MQHRLNTRSCFSAWLYCDQIAALCPLIIYTLYLISWPTATQHMSHSQYVCPLLLVLIYNSKRTDWIATVQSIGCDSHALLAFGCFKNCTELGKKQWIRDSAMELHRRCHFSIQTQPHAGIYAETAKKKLPRTQFTFSPHLLLRGM